MKQIQKFVLYFAILIVGIVNQVAIQAAEKKSSLLLNEQQNKMAIQVTAGIGANQITRVNSFYELFEEELMTYENIEYANELLEVFYQSVMNHLRKVNKLEGLKNESGKRFLKFYKQSERKLKKKKLAQKQVAFQDIKNIFVLDPQELSTLSVEQITNKLLTYVKDNDEDNAKVVTEFLTANYFMPEHRDLIRNILKNVENLHVDNNTYDKVIYNLTHHYINLTEKWQKQQPSIGEIKSKLGIQ